MFEIKGEEHWEYKLKACSEAYRHNQFSVPRNDHEAKSGTAEEEAHKMEHHQIICFPLQLPCRNKVGKKTIGEAGKQLLQPSENVIMQACFQLSLTNRKQFVKDHGYTAENNLLPRTNMKAERISALFPLCCPRNNRAGNIDLAVSRKRERVFLTREAERKWKSEREMR